MILTLVIDLNREVAISPEYLPSLVRHVVNPRISRTIIPVIYNMCNDYGGSRPYISKRLLTNCCTERAQHALRMSGLCPALIKLVQNPQFQAPDLLTYVYSLLDISSHQCMSTDSPGVMILTCL